jgi:hypothetical protein
MSMKHGHQTTKPKMPLHEKTAWGIIVFIAIISVLVFLQGCRSYPTADWEAQVAAYESYHRSLITDRTPLELLDDYDLTDEQREQAIRFIEGIEHVGE